MKLDWRSLFASFWSPPDRVLASAGRSGEVLMAKIRLGLAAVILTIPVLDALFFSIDRKEALVGFGLALGTFLFAATAYLLLAREFNPPWLLT